MTLYLPKELHKDLIFGGLGIKGIPKGIEERTLTLIEIPYFAVKDTDISIYGC